MKTTVELPEELLREAKAAAAREGRSLKDLLTAALRDHLRRGPEGGPGKEPWRAAFGGAKPSEVREVDAVIAEDLERIDPESWRESSG